MINEKDVEFHYKKLLEELFPEGKTDQSPFKTDGLLKCNDFDMLLEFKFDLDFNKKADQVNVLIQVLYYLKQFEKSESKFPTLVFVGDKNECFVVPTSKLVPYLTKDIDWSVAPSNAHKHPGNIGLIREIIDSDISCFTFNRGFVDFKKDLKDKIINLKDNNHVKIKCTLNNIENVYKYFLERFDNRLKNLNSNEKANLFIQILVNKDKNYIHPAKPILVTESYGDISIDRKNYENFFSHYSPDYTQKEKRELTNCVDRLVEDQARRRKGEFYTPKIWVDRAHMYLEEVFGENYKEDYIFWDNSCGLGALTKDYKIEELIQTTIENGDIDTIKAMKYNPNSLKIKLDFLNDDIPQEIVNKIQGKKLIVLMNPPYKTAGNNKRDSDSDEGVAESIVRDQMIKEKWSGYGQLYAQFIYRSLKLKELYNCEVNLGVFAPPLYMSSSSFKKFRDKMFKQVEYVNGFMFRADEFSGTASNWSIVFSIFKNK